MADPLNIEIVPGSVDTYVPAAEFGIVSAANVRMSAFEKTRTPPITPAQVPKNHSTLVLVLGIALAVGAGAMIVIGFLDASMVAPDETSGPAPQVVVPVPD